MYYVIYKTTNLVNKKYYIGAHEAKSLDDDYLGSGKILFRAIKKYGKENFARTILHFCASKEDMYKLEAEIVNESLVNDKTCYNLKIGGEGGWSHWNDGSDNHIQMCKIAGNKNIDRLVKLNKSEAHRELGRTSKMILDNDNKYHLGHKHSDEVKKLITENNLQRRWVCTETVIKMIHVDDLKEYLTNGYQNGKRWRKNSPTLGTAWINKDNKNKLIKKDLLDEWLTDGWIRGRINPLQKYDCTDQSNLIQNSKQ